MKNTFKLSTLALLAVSANAFAHHPAADIVDPEVYEMIEENISDVHLALTFDDMGSDTADAGSAMQGQDTDAGAAMDVDVAEAGAAMAESVDVSSMAEVEPAGQMGPQR